MGRLLSRLFLLAVIVGGAGFFLAPGLAFYAVRSAAQEGDMQALSALVDFPAVRTSLRPQIEAGAARTPPPAFLDDPIGAVRRRIEEAARPAPDADAYLTAPALHALTLGEGRYASERSREGAASAGGEAESAPWPRLRHWGFERTRLAIADEGGSETVFSFERRGAYRWVLVHVGLPDGGTPPGPETVGSES